jgi:hypothetical protein
MTSADGRMATAGDVFGQNSPGVQITTTAPGGEESQMKIKFFVDTGRPSHGIPRLRFSHDPQHAWVAAALDTDPVRGQRNAGPGRSLRGYGESVRRDQS